MNVLSHEKKDLVKESRNNMENKKIDVEIRMIEAYIFSKTDGVSLQDISKRLKIKKRRRKTLFNRNRTSLHSRSTRRRISKNGNKYRFEIKPEIKSMIFPNPRKLELTETQFEVLTILFMNGEVD